MNAQALILPLLVSFVHCFTTPGFAHFAHFVLAHMALLGLPHCGTETLRLTQFHTVVHWTTPYAFMTRGRRPLRGAKLTAQQLYHRSQRRSLTVRIYGKTVTLIAYVGVLIPSPRLGNAPLRVLIFPQRSGHKMKSFFSTDSTMDPVRLLELYAAHLKIEDIFDEMKTTGGFADCRQRSFPALKRHATLCLVAYGLLRLLSVTLKQAAAVEAAPWWYPAGPPSVTRLRRAVFKALRISAPLHAEPKVDENLPLKREGGTLPHRPSLRSCGAEACIPRQEASYERRVFLSGMAI